MSEGELKRLKAELRALTQRLHEVLDRGIQHDRARAERLDRRAAYKRDQRMRANRTAPRSV